VVVADILPVLTQHLAAGTKKDPPIRFLTRRYGGRCTDDCGARTGSKHYN